MNTTPVHKAQELITYLVKQLVDLPGMITVAVHQDNDAGVRLLITADQQDKGKVIGKHGQTIKMLRTLVQLMMHTTAVTVEMAR